MYSVKKLKKKILAMITVMALLFANFVPNLSNVIDASAATEPAFPSVDKVIAKAATLLGTPYSFGKKGYSGIYDLGHYGKLSLDYVRGQGIDCSGLIYYTMTQLGYKTSGFEFQNPVPVDTAHWLSVNSSSTITYGGVTAKINVEKKNISTKTRPYWQCSDGTTITPGSVVIAENPNGTDHSWIYMGEFASRTEVINYLKKIGVSTSLINSSTVGDGKGDGGTHWRIEANSGRGVCINNNTDGKSSSAFNMYAFRITDRNVTFEIEKSDSDGNLVGKSDVDGSTAVYYIYSDKACKKKVGSITIGTNGKGSTTLPNATYYAKEVKAPWGYKLDTTVHTIKAGVNKFKEDFKTGKIFIQKYADNEYISRVEGYSTIQKFMCFAVQKKNGSSWQYVGFKVVSGNTYTYNGKTTYDPYVIYLNKDGAFKLVDLPYGTYRIYEIWRNNSDEALKAAGLEEPPDIPMKEFTVDENMDTTQEIVNTKTRGPDITVKKYAEDESIVNVTGYETVQSGLSFALKTPIGSGKTWDYVYFKKSGNKYTYSSVGTGDKPYQLKLDDKGEFVLSGLPYGKYRLYEQWSGTAAQLKAAGLQTPPSTYVKEFTVSASVSKTQKVINQIVTKGSLEIDKKIEMVDKNADIPSSAYTSLSFTIKNKPGQYLVLDTVDAAKGTYKYNTTTATEAKATQIKLGTSTRKAVVTDMPIDTGYVVKETCGNKRFIASSDTVTVNIAADTSTYASFTNREVYGSIRGVKADKSNPNKKIVGAVYGLFEEGTTEFNTRTAYKITGSNIDGVFTFSKVPYGNYIIREIIAPKGYELSDEQKNVTISSQDQQVSFQVEDPPINIWISKKSVTGDDELAGAKMQLRTSTGSVIDSWTSGSSAHIVECIAAGSYVIHEEAAPNGYVLAEDISFDIDANGEVTGDISTSSTADGEPIIIMTDDITKVTVYKIDITNDKEIAGAKLQIKDSAGKVVDSWTSTNEPHEINGKLIAGATYTLHEELAPDGYVIAKDVAFTVDATGKVTEVTMTDDVTKVKVHKKDITNSAELAGAKLQIKDSAGKVVDSWTSTNEPHEINGKLIAGATYTLHEEFAPDGYVIAKDVAFTVDPTGKITEVTMTDDVTKVTVHKKDITNSAELAGAKLQIKDSAGKVVDSWTSTNEPHEINGKLIAGATYTLHEELAPDGYVIAKDVAFTVDATGKVTEVTMTDDVTKIRVSKKTLTGSDELVGAHMKLIDSNGTVVDEWISTSEPHDIYGKLIAGQTYTLHEEISPDGYVVANDIEFTVSADGSIDVVEMHDDTTKIRISKQDITNSQELAGAKLQVKDSDGNIVDEWTSTDTPHYIEGKLIAGETYTLHEEYAPNGYVIANDIEFTVSADGRIDVVEMRDDTTKVRISKKTITGDDELAGAKLQVKDSDGNVVDEWTSTDKPHYIEGKLTAGQTYTLHEEYAPNGYVIANDIEFTVSADGRIDVVEMRDDTTKVRISKKTITGDDELAGAKLQVKDSDGNVVDEWTSTDKPHYIEGKLTAGQTYTLHEEYAPNGYVIANDIEFTVSADGSIDVVEMHDDTTKIRISKQDITNSQELAGAKLQVKDSDGNIVDEWTSTDTPHYIEGKLIAGETYTLHEEIAPNGYVVANDIEFTVSKDGSVDTVTMIDDTTKVKISKQDITNGKELAGAKLQVKDSDGNVVDDWTSTDKPHYIEGKLTAGETYTLHEEIAPNGYVVANDIEFTVSKDGSVDTVTMIDDTTKVKISKQDITNGKELAGAKLQVKDSNGTVVDEWTSTSEPHDIYGKLVAGQTYTLHEEYAPDGYVVANDIEFTVSADGSIDVVEMHDDTTKIRISKQDITNSQELAGAKLQVKDSDGNIVDEWTSTDTPHYIEGKLIAGETYTLHEEYAPNGYVIANDIEFTVSKDGSVDTVTMIDDTTKVKISKQDITNGKELAGAKLQVKDSDGNVVDDWTSTDKPHYIEGKLTAGETYTLHEEIAPNGYVVANDIEFTVSKDGSVDTVTMIDDTTKVKISKQDITNGKELAGAKLQVKDSDGNVVDDWTSTDKPHYIEGKLTAGETYTLHEEIAPNGYVVANDIEFTVSKDGSVDKVVMKDDTTKVQISKQDITTGKELAGAKLKIVDKDGNTIKEWVSTDKPTYFEKVFKAGETYTLIEETAPNGYVVSEKVAFTVSDDGSIDKVVMKDDTTKVSISKKDITNDKELAGAKLQVKDSDGNVVDEWTSTDKPHMIEGKLVANKTYTLHEEVAPDGYVVANDIEFTVSSDGSIDVVEMIDDIAKGTVSVQKTTEGMLNIEGIDLVLSGVSFLGLDVNITATTDENGIAVFKGVPVGTYTITEEESTVPYGYLVADPIEGVEVVYAQQTDVEIYNAEMTGSIAVNKTTEGMVNLEGIEFILSGITDTGREIELKALTDEAGTAIFENVPIGTYTITENGETVPYGYLTADPIEGVEVVYAQQTDVEIYNAEMTGSIAVNKTTEGMVNLEGIEFILSGITDTGREIELKALTDEAGTAIFENVPIGTYTITENGETVPYGYLTADPIEGVEVVYAQQTDVEIYNAEMTGSIAVNKTTEGMVNLEGIEFILSGITDTGREIELKALTDEAGTAIFENVPIGTYTITENGETVPYGYLTADPVEGVEVVYAQQTDVEIFNAEMTGSIRVQKKTEGMKDLEGIGFTLSGTTATGRDISLYVKTDKDGLAVFEGVPVGTYTLTEDGQTVPKGYLIARAVEGVEVVYAQQTDVTVVNDKVPVNESPKTGDTAPYEMVVVCTLIAAAALLLRKRTDNFID